MRKLEQFDNLNQLCRYCGRLWSFFGARLSSRNDRSLLQTTTAICRNDCDGWRRCWNCFIFSDIEGGRGVSNTIRGWIRERESNPFLLPSNFLLLFGFTQPTKEKFEEIFPINSSFSRYFSPLFHRKIGWRLGLQFVAVLVSLSFFMGLLYRPASLYHPQRRAILHLKNSRKKVRVVHTQISFSHLISNLISFYDIDSCCFQYLLGLNQFEK